MLFSRYCKCAISVIGECMDRQFLTGQTVFDWSKQWNKFRAKFRNNSGISSEFSDLSALKNKNNLICYSN